MVVVVRFEYGRPSIFTIESVANEVANGNVDAIYHGGDIRYLNPLIPFLYDKTSIGLGDGVYRLEALVIYICVCSYATGYIAVWDFYMDQISSMAGGAIYLTTVGKDRHIVYLYRT